MASIKKRTDGRYRARYRDAAGKEHAKHFDPRVDAQRWLDGVTASQVRGDYIDPKAGKVTFADFAHKWLAAQTFDELTREGVASRLKVHILPTFGDMELRAVRASTVQAWLRARQQHCAPGFVRVLLVNLSSIFRAAVDDGLIARNPCSSRSVRPPTMEKKKVIPWSSEQVAAVIDAHPEQWRAAPIVAAGCGLRQGEVFGLRVKDVDFLGRRLFVRQQVKPLHGVPTVAPPKGRKTREVPLPETVAFAMSEHLRKFPPVDDMVFTSPRGRLMGGKSYNRSAWKPALAAAGIASTRENGMHALRHYYASVQLEAGTSIRALAEYLGHHDPGFTLRTYCHLMPSSDERAREAIDSAFRSVESAESRGLSADLKLESVSSSRSDA